MALNRNLLLVPTQLELDLLARESFQRAGFSECQLCGFGPVASATSTMQSLLTSKPDHVWLIGIAGSYLDEVPVGSATCFSEVSMHGIGAQDPSGLQLPSSLQLPQWNFNNGEQSVPIYETLPLALPKTSTSAAHLLTVCAAAGSDADVSQRREMFPSCVAEDMEGFGVALACRIAGVPLTIVRGISNRAGDRRKQHWQIKPAMQAAQNLTLDLIHSLP